MGKPVTGAMTDYNGKDSLDYKGRVIIEWPCGGAKNSVLPTVLSRVLDTETEELIPCAGFTVRAHVPGLIFADVAVYLDEHGEICRDPYQIARSDGVPATFPFLVSEMRVM